ncbi:MAG: formylglycine-generating enzyme family protein [Myxococcota bacterium]
MLQVSLASVLSGLACTPQPPTRDQDLIWVEPGRYSLGSDAGERELGYRLSSSVIRTQHWYDLWERAPRSVDLTGFWLERTPVTQAAYAAFVRETGHRAPDISAKEYRKQGFLVHSYATVQRYRWTDGDPPADARSHPVVLVSRTDARAYCHWRGRRLPTEDEWEAACRGLEHRRFPWGPEWGSNRRAQVQASGTAPVDAHPAGATPSGILDLAGNVFEWTASKFDAQRATLRGCAWDDAPGTCRCAFRHGRPAEARHILIGFRCAAGA